MLTDLRTRCFPGSADDQLGEDVGHLAIGDKVGSHVALHPEGDVGGSDPLTECLPVDARTATGRGVGMPHVVSQVTQRA